MDYKIILDDGTEVKAHLNMNTWESDTELNDALFENNTSNVSYVTPEGDTVVLGECKYIRGAYNGKVYMFFLNPLTEEEKREKRIDKQIADNKAINGETWNPQKVYVDGEMIIYGGSFARCLHTNRGIKPTNKVYWELSSVSDMILELMERVSALEQEGE